MPLLVPVTSVKIPSQNDFFNRKINEKPGGGPLSLVANTWRLSIIGGQVLVSVLGSSRARS